jgi:hypothetical protein
MIKLYYIINYIMIVNNNPNKLSFDTSSISQNGFDNAGQLGSGIVDQARFVSNYSSYQPNNTFNNTNNSLRATNENFNNYAGNETNRVFQQNKVIEKMPDNKYLHNTLYDNLNENLNKEQIQEYRLNIDSMDRDVTLYPDPFKYTVTFGPVVNSGIDTTIQRIDNKNQLKNEIKKINKKINPNTPVKASQADFDDDMILLETNPNILVNYDNTLKRIFNPYITRSFVNVKFIRLDNVVLPRFNKIIINSNWNYCTSCYGIDCESCHLNSSNGMAISDDYQRVKTEMIKNDRYIPDDNHLGPLFTDRYVLVGIKEIANNQNLATNQINSSSFTIFPDKYMGLLYWRGSPYYAVKIYKDSLLGNINKLSFEFFDSWGFPITLNRTCVDYETNQIIQTKIMNPNNLNIKEIVADTKFTNFFLKKTSEIIKCFVIVNFNIKNKIPYYFDKETADLMCGVCENQSNQVNQPNQVNHNKQDCCVKKILVYPVFNKSTFDFTNIFTELNQFVTLNGFVSVYKLTTTGQKVYVDINQYIDNVIWFNYGEKYLNEIKFNMNAFYSNYKNFGFKILDKLKTEALSIPLNKYFQNHMMFVMGIYTNELNTKVDYYAR